MKNKVLLGLFVLYTSLSFAQGFLKTEGEKILDSENNKVLLKGIGLGGYMLQEGYMLKVPFSGQQHVFKQHIEDLIGTAATEDFYKAWRKNFIQKEDIDSLKSWGFNSVRLPMHYNLYTLPVSEEPKKGKNTWLETGFRMTDSLINWCRQNNMYLILDMHATPGGQGHDVNISDRDPSQPSLWESEENQKKLIALWEKLAQRYKNEPIIAAYDIINEPNWSFEKGRNKNGTQDTKNAPLKKLMKEITKAIRKIDQNHILIIEGNGWGNNYNGILPPWDKNMVLSFHKYWNKNTQSAIQQFLDYRKKYNLPIWLGESGENSNTWFTDAISLMEENNIGWCWWPLKKLGANNPLQIKVNSGYSNLLQYWQGKAKKPSKQEAMAALMQLAENTKIENCIYHKGVIDAMMRQPHTTEIVPFKQVLIKDQATIQAINYDMGKNGIAYQDKVAGNYYISTGGQRQAWNLGNTYRNDGVDIFEDGKTTYVGNLESGEWMKYSFQVEDPGEYKLNFKIASKNKDASAKIELNTNNLGKLEIPDTSQAWKSIYFKKIKLTKGENQLTFYVENGGFNFEEIQFQKIK